MLGGFDLAAEAKRLEAERADNEAQADEAATKLDRFHKLREAGPKLYEMLEHVQRVLTAKGGPTNAELVGLYSQINVVLREATE